MGIVQLMSVVSLTVIVAYVVLSVESALRMLVVHGRYVHIEYRAAGSSPDWWSSKHARALRPLQLFAGLATLVLIGCGPTALLWAH